MDLIRNIKETQKEWAGRVQRDLLSRPLGSTATASQIDSISKHTFLRGQKFLEGQSGNKEKRRSGENMEPKTLNRNNKR